MRLVDDTGSGSGSEWAFDDVQAGMPTPNNSREPCRSPIQLRFCTLPRSTIRTDCGVAFTLLSGTGGTWTELLLHRFVDTDGAFPLSGITYYRGNYYGTTSITDNRPGGMVFELTPGHGGPWNFTNIYSFGGPGEGGTPYSGVIVDNHGNLYGTTYTGGSNGYATAYKLSPPSGSGAWTETILESFSYPSSFAPMGGLLLRGNKLFGTTTDCTSGFFACCGGYGNVFAITNF